MTKQLQLFDDLYAKGRPRAKGLWQRLHRFFFGDDIFISYSRSDSGKYVAALAAWLTDQKYLCYFDQLGTDVNKNLPDSLKGKVGTSTALVLVGTGGAAASPYVREEVEIFKESRRAIIPINVDGALLDREWPELTGLSRIPESGRRVARGEPDPTTLALLKNSCRYRRRSQWLRLSLLAGFSFIALAALVSLAAVLRSRSAIANARTEADLIKLQAEQQVEGANKRVSDANQDARTAETAKKVSEGEADTARREARGAVELKERAVSQQQLAEAGMRRAQQLERRANESAAEATRQEQGSRATLLSREPGKEFDALALAVKAAEPGTNRRRALSEQVVNGLASSLLAVDYSRRIADPPGEIADALLAPDGSKVFYTYFDEEKSALRWALLDVRTGRRTFLRRYAKDDLNDAEDHVDDAEEDVYDARKHIRFAAFSRDGQRLLTQANSVLFPLEAWELSGPEPKPLNSPCFERVGTAEHAALDKDGSHVLSIRGLEATVCEVDSGKEDPPFKFTPEMKAIFFKAAAFTAENKPALYGVKMSSVEAIAASRETALVNYLGTNQHVEINTPGGSFAGFGDDGSVVTFGAKTQLWNRDFTGVRIQSAGGEVRTLKGYQGKILSVAYSGGRAHVLTISQGRFLRVADARTHPAYQALRAHDRPIRKAVFSPDGKRVITTGEDKTARVWDATTGDLLHTLRLPGYVPLSETSADGYSFSSLSRAAAFSRDSARVAAVVYTPAGYQLQTWDTRTGRTVCPALDRRPDGQAGVEYKFGHVAGMIFFRGNDYLLVKHDISPFNKYPLGVWDARTCQLVKRISLEDGQEFSSFSADGTSLNTVSDFSRWVSEGDQYMAEIKRYDLAEVDLLSGAPVTLKGVRVGLTPAFKAARVFPDGERIIIALGFDDANPLAVWEPRGKSGVSLEGSRSDQGWEVSADGTHVAQIFEGVVSVWDALSGQLLTTFTPPSGIAMQSALALSPDGSRLIIASPDGTARIYPTSGGVFFEAARKLNER